ncbi:TIM barrel protein [candidate division KSB1 bacterium]|nr:TIM barrel protein [candidate division KSB1 bacterium]
MSQSRRDFFKIGAMGIAAAGSLSGIARNAKAQSKNDELPLGIASYTFRKFSLDETIEMTRQMGVKNIALKSMHMPLDASTSEIKAAATKVRDAGLNLYGAGVIYMKSEADVNQAFDYAQAAELKVIIGVPNHELLQLVEKKVKETDIIVAIHNHGPGDDLYPSPESIYEKVKDLDKRIGICMDIGHTQRIKLDPSEQAEKYRDRLHDVHIKDVSWASAKGTTVEIGRGVIDIPEFIETLRKIEYDGMVSLEYEKDADNPLCGAAESIGYTRGVMAAL